MIKFTVIFMLFAAYCFSQTSKQIINANSTLNVTDSAGKKQEHWIITGNMRPKQSVFLPNQIMEEGYYKDNRKTGVWKEYYANGVQRNELTFVNGRPDGYAVMYHDNGCKSEEGMWKNNRWTGIYKEYDVQEKLIREFDFKDGGKREGRIMSH